MDGETPLVSVVIPTLNRCNTLQDTINSVRGQLRDFPIEIVVSDNCSTDETQALLTGGEYPDIRYFRHDPRISRVSNFMFAFRAAQGKYVTILYDDEVMLQGNLATKVPILEQHPDVVAVISSGTTRQRLTGKLTPGIAMRPEFCIEDRPTYLLNTFKFTTGGLPPVLMRRSVLDTLSLEERDDPLDDNAFILNLSRYGRIALLPDGFHTDTEGPGEMVGNGLMEPVASRREPGRMINMPGVWFYWSQSRFRMEHILRSDDLSPILRWRLMRIARSTLRVGVWKAIYFRFAAGEHPIRLALGLLRRAYQLSPWVLVPPISVFVSKKATRVDAPIPPLAHTPRPLPVAGVPAK